jgi:hypothetical protein
MPIRYFIPDWDDRVDPHYNFIADTHTPGRNPYRDDVYAHQIYMPPPYDGVLLSRAVLDESGSKYQAIQDVGSVHHYLRLPEGHQVMGDCGAFSYWKDPEPPYQTDEMLDFYQRMGFDIGVSIDHLIFAELEAEKERRWDLTQANAEEFLQRYRQGNYSFTPMGVAQGWDADSYQRAARALVQMGYTHIAIGGLVRSQNTEIIRVLTAVQEVLRPGMQVHLFGVSRPDQVPTFMRLGITSFDSASRLRRAWMDGRRNYFLGDAAYSAIRIPEARALARKQHLDEHATIRMEQAAFATLRAFHRGAASLEATWEAAVAYAALSGKATDRLKQDYRETLEVRPWQQCECAICRAIGVEVIIFRGNNRNRRRGFHNTWQLYQHLQRIDQHNGPPPKVVTQLTLEGEQVLDMEK